MESCDHGVPLEAEECKQCQTETTAKGCPFCGNSWGPAQSEKSDTGRYQFGCTNPHCGGSAGWADTEVEALKLWNTRPCDRCEPVPSDCPTPSKCGYVGGDQD